MVAADGESVAVAAEQEHVEIGPGETNAGGERDGAAVNECAPWPLTKYGKRDEQPIPARVTIFSCSRLRFSRTL